MTQDTSSGTRPFWARHTRAHGPARSFLGSR